jgi:hypothetical protein
MDVETGAYVEEKISYRFCDQMPIRRVHRPTIVKQIEGLLDHCRPAVEFLLDFVPLLYVFDAISNEIPELRCKRISGVFQVRRTRPKKITDTLSP